MKILIIDDHPLFIEGISHVIQLVTESACITKAASAIKAMALLDSGEDFDLVLLDLNMPGTGGIDFLQHFKAEELCIPIVIVSSEEQVELIQQTLDWGVMGFIPKSHSVEDMVAAINKVLSGEIYLPETIQQLLKRLPTLEQRIQEYGISKKQLEVLNLLAKGLSNEQIANTLHRTEHTVKSHVSALFQILGATNRTECARIAIQKSLVRPTDIA